MMESTPELDAALDLLPEYLHYRDEGCEFDESCLNCRLPLCIHDEARGKQHWLTNQRDGRIIKLYAQGRNMKELAAIFGVSVRTVRRALQKRLPETQQYPEDMEGRDAW